MISLRPYKNCDAKYIVKWFKSEFDFRQWSADRYNTFPIAEEDMNLYYEKNQNNSDIWGMTACDENGIIGHFTMRFPNDSREEIRLGFVIVDDTKRGKGYGKEMVSLAVRFAFDFVRVQKVTLGVFENNTRAINCYKSCGFKEVDSEKNESYICMGDEWNCIQMELSKEDYELLTTYKITEQVQ